MQPPQHMQAKVSVFAAWLFFFFLKNSIHRLNLRKTIDFPHAMGIQKLSKHFQMELQGNSGGAKRRAGQLWRKILMKKNFMKRSLHSLK